ncbi:hypothetical protein [Bartonella harrusi]|uniref:Protein-disulfide reductase n=1 Tax=Bartonella harrusi TaxID=2961895 RepID=A0ABY5ETP2_9HYPH|nr:hypothetical protein [Bartonella harrusi]UTO27753.1 hypothetical protein NMK50_05730 [Bartonella harrusi]
MIKVLKGHMLNILIAIAFSLSQVANTHANHLSNNAQQKDIFVMESVKKKAINIATLYVPILKHRVRNEDTIEGEFQKVFEPITIGTFTTLGAIIFGYFTGFFMSLFSGIVGIGIGKTK